MNSSSLTPMNLNQTLGLRVREARKRLGMSQQELSALLEFEHVQTISQIENGERQVKAWELARISSVLHTSINELLKEDAFAEPVVLWREQPENNYQKIETEFLHLSHNYDLVATLAARPPMPQRRPAQEPGARRWRDGRPPQAVDVGPATRSSLVR